MNINTKVQLTEIDFEAAYQIVKVCTLTAAEIKKQAVKLASTKSYSGNVGSAEFLLIRMHVLVHGSVSGISSDNIEKFYYSTTKMIDFAHRRGVNVIVNIKRAKINMHGRRVKNEQKVATKMMSDYYRGNKAALPKNISSAENRNILIADVMAGLTAEEAFQRLV